MPESLKRLAELSGAKLRVAGTYGLRVFHGSLEEEIDAAGEEAACPELHWPTAVLAFI
jgi:hypothetical protein